MASNSNKYSLYVKLKGGLGNQMFQYAMGRALALRNGMNLVLDPTSGFIRDKIYRRTFALGDFPVSGSLSGRLEQLPFWFELMWKKTLPNWKALRIRPWGRYACEQELNDKLEILNWRLESNTWIEGYWQSEQYFLDSKTQIGAELAPPFPSSGSVAALGREIDASESVAVGVRLYEEVPGRDTTGVVSYSFYEEAVEILLNKQAIKCPIFYVFCTKLPLVQDKLNLPGKIVYVTHDNGYEGQNDRLWLISRCKHHIVSNSTFYWWGAWLAEFAGRGGQIIAADPFPFPNTIPSRWIKHPFQRTAP